MATDAIQFIYGTKYEVGNIAQVICKIRINIY
jgi:hypothetical protein